ncbi:MAG: hypothetical protein SF053_09805 [Bacteroidia bacterium]|nr:hypothetical protein [Bacteroidia bacterium]
MKKVIIICLAISIHIVSLAQTTTKIGTPIENRLGFSVGYYGDNFSNFGYQLGIERYLATTANFQVIGSLSITNYFVKQNFTAYSFNPRIGIRYTTDFGLTLESHLGLGYLYRSYKFDEYDVNSQGQVVSKGKASQSSVMPNLAIGIGYDLRKKFNFPLVYIVRGSINYNYPNKHFLFEASYALETGIVFIPNLQKSKLKNDNTSR